MDRRVAEGASVVQALMDETRETYRACKDVCFDGNGYSDEWKAEAKRRGLDCETSAPVCYDAFISPRTIETYKAVGVMNEVELKARTEINWEIYSKKIEIEARVLADLTANHILPVSTRYQSILLDNVSKMKEIFTDSFRAINENFGRIFAELFGGGEASLVLEDESDVLSCGIGIQVAPPGKVIKNLEALSGGEQALVAISIYFAILAVNPSPFCILDEIEAALDDVNVTRYAQYLRRMTERTQFIVITHRRGTMEAADVLYGVTMQEDGVSKILRLDLENVSADLIS